MTRCLALLIAIPLAAGLEGNSSSNFSDPAAVQEADDERQVVSGKADFLRRVPKRFGILLEYLPESHSVRLQLEGDDEPTDWPVNLDAEIKVHGWWGRLEQVRPGDRVWVWFSIDRREQPVSVLMLADEISEGDIHGQTTRLTGWDSERRTITIETDGVGVRELTLDESLGGEGDDGQLRLALEDEVLFDGSADEAVYVQTAGEMARLVVGMEPFGRMREQQREWMRDQWRTSGLPGSIGLLHPLSGEMEVMLDHESIRWARYLSRGDEVVLLAGSDGREIRATVKSVVAWREKTRVHLVNESGVDQLELTVAQRISLRVSEPPLEIQQSDRPTDTGRPRTREERVQWVLANVYCPCRIRGDQCTGMFYTQASCNVAACGMPNRMSSLVERWIDEELDDMAILDRLGQEYGPQVFHPHLLR